MVRNKPLVLKLVATYIQQVGEEGMTDFFGRWYLRRVAQHATRSQAGRHLQQVGGGREMYAVYPALKSLKIACTAVLLYYLLNLSNLL